MKPQEVKTCKIRLIKSKKKNRKEDINCRKVHYKILNCFTKHKKLLLNYSSIASDAK